MFPVLCLPSIRINYARYLTGALCVVLISLSATARADENVAPLSSMQSLFSKAQTFAAIYEPDLGPEIDCQQVFNLGVKACFAALRNDGNAPYILLPRLSPALPVAKGVVVLFHGLSDSPYFVSSIGEFLRNDGYVVIAPLTPGHGKKEANADMQDNDLQARWYTHVDSVMTFANEMAQSANLPLVVGGFSTGGAFATYYTINHPEKVAALLLFSGALSLAGSVETVSNIWGMKSLAKWLDGDYITDGPHPFKYPAVATYSALVLMDIIHDIRDTLATKQITMPIFAAHSMADTTTLFAGIESLTGQISGNHTVFKIDESYQLCHADLPMSSVQVVNLTFDKSNVNEGEECKIPRANPLHQNMLLMLDRFLSEQLTTA